jgi:hypothetical protein
VLAYLLNMSIHAYTTGLSLIAGPESSRFDHLAPKAEDLRDELTTLLQQLRDVEQQIRAVKDTMYGLSLVFGEDVVSDRLLDTIRPKVRTRARGLTNACKLALMKAPQPCSVGTVCGLVTEMDPTLLMHHRNPRASVMSVLRNFASKGEVLRKTENGRWVWQWAEWEPLHQLKRA